MTRLTKVKFGSKLLDDYLLELQLPLKSENLGFFLLFLANILKTI